MDTQSFEQLGIDASLIERLSQHNIESPSPVQKKVIPLIAEGGNMLFQSETGTGKTFAYLLPLIQKLQKNPNGNKSVRLLIASPTYELAAQIKVQVQMITDLGCVLCIGGSPLNRQIEQLKTKPDIVIGGTSRLLELIHLKKLKADAVECLVLDETDRLLSKEMREATQALLERLPQSVQIIGCSATVNEYTVRTLQDCRKSIFDGQVLSDMTLVRLPAEEVLRKRISHWAIYAERRNKIDTLRSFINACKGSKIIVFTSRNDQLPNIVQKLQFRKIACEGLSAKEDKKLRKAAIDRFRSGKIKVLVTTDLASRGLDIADVSHVVQMDLPEGEDFFIHRAGRTARMGKSGINCVIGDEKEMRRYAALEKKLGITVYPKELFKGKVLSPEECQ